MSTNLDWVPAFLQVNDSLFPTGAYAHSVGFEEFAHLAFVRDEAGLRSFVEMHLLPALAEVELPYLRFAYEAAGELDLICEIDRKVSAWKLARETRDASIAIGRRRLAALRAVSDRPQYAEFAAAITRGDAHGHHLTVCAVQASGEDFPIGAVLGAWYYQAIAGACSASLKLIRIGQEGSQRVLRGAIAHAGSTIARSLEVAPEEAGFFDPLLEIASMRHEFSDERLFIS